MQKIASLEIYAAPGVDHAITVSEVRCAIRNLKTGKAPGVDLITAELLKTLLDEDEEEDPPMLTELVRILNRVLDLGKVPKEWQEAIVRPAFKAGDRAAWDNYRLISLTSVVGKLFEAVIATRLERAFAGEGLLSEHQYGFRRGRSCEHAQWVLAETIKARAARNLETHVAFLDAKKAYPSVHRAAMMSKLHSMIAKLQDANPDKQSKVWRIIRQMYDNVTSVIRVTPTDGEPGDSDPYAVNEGLREGSALAPMLYTICHKRHRRATRGSRRETRARWI